MQDWVFRLGSALFFWLINQLWLQEVPEFSCPSFCYFQNILLQTAHRQILNLNSNIFENKIMPKVNSLEDQMNRKWWAHQIKLQIYESCFHQSFSPTCLSFEQCKKNGIGQKRNWTIRLFFSQFWAVQKNHNEFITRKKIGGLSAFNVWLFVHLQNLKCFKIYVQSS